MTERYRSTSRDRDEGRGSRDSRDDRGSRDRGGRDDRGGREESTRGGREESRDRGGRERGSERGSERGGGRSSGYVYQRRSAESVQKRATASSKDFDTFIREDVPKFKPNDGGNLIRILPPTFSPADHYGIDAWVHYGVGPDEQSYLCLHKMKNEPCPICDERDRARRGGESEEYVKDLEPTRRVLFYLVDRDDEKKGVQAWAAPFSKIDQAIVKVSVDPRTNEVLPIDDPVEGFDIMFDKGGKGIGTQYTGVAIARRESSLGKDEWLDFAIKNPLPDILEYYSYDHIEKAFGGGGSHTTRSDREGRDGGGRDRAGGSDSGRGSSRDDPRDSAGRDGHGGSERGSGRGRREEPKEPEFTWESVHSMSAQELDDLVEDQKLDIDPNKADSDDQLADWICEELKIEKSTRRESSREAPRDEKKADEGDHRDRLRNMREGRR